MKTKKVKCTKSMGNKKRKQKEKKKGKKKKRWYKGKAFGGKLV